MGCSWSLRLGLQFCLQWSLKTIKYVKLSTSLILPLWLEVYLLAKVQYSSKYMELRFCLHLRMKKAGKSASPALSVTASREICKNHNFSWTHYRDLVISHPEPKEDKHCLACCGREGYTKDKRNPVLKTEWACRRLQNFQKLHIWIGIHTWARN